jgi:SAM-dependent methyltransferase
MQRADQVHKYDFDNPSFFEELHRNRFGPECEFLTQVFRAQSGISRVLDAACGTGAHAAILARHGFTVTGIDLNANMVEYARSHNPELDFHLGDMRDLSFIEAFDAVICLCTSFSYNITNEDVVEALQGFQRALRRNGLLVIDVFNWISLLENRGFLKEIREEGAYARMNLTSVRETAVDERRQLLVERRTLSRKDSSEIIQMDITKYRLFFPQEFRYFLETNGFKLVEFYSGFDLEWRGLRGPRLITISIKK